MSERKSDEIKFRVEPSVKARWQAAADREQLGLSEFMRRAAEREANPSIVLDAQGSTFTTQLAKVREALPVQEVEKLVAEHGLQGSGLAEQTRQVATESLGLNSDVGPLVVKRDWKPFGA